MIIVMMADSHQQHLHHSQLISLSVLLMEIQFLKEVLQLTVTKLIYQHHSLVKMHLVFH